MRRVDASVLLGGVAALTLWLSLTEGMLRYVRPSMRPWLVASGVFLALLAGAVAVSARRAGPGSERPPACGPDGNGAVPDGAGGRRRGLGFVGWLLVVPLVVAAGIDPGALGAYTIRRSAGGAPAVEFDLEQHLRTRSFGGQDPELLLHEFLVAADGDTAEQRLLASTPVRLTGFVVGGESDDAFRLARLMIGCCAGDAVGLVVEVHGYDGEPLADESWVEVTGTYDPAATEAARAAAGDGWSAPVLHPASVRRVGAPSEPYEYPR